MRELFSEYTRVSLQVPLRFRRCGYGYGYGYGDRFLLGVSVSVSVINRCRAAIANDRLLPFRTILHGRSRRN